MTLRMIAENLPAGMCVRSSFTVVGVLVEVPVMLSVVWVVNRSKDWYERGEGLSEASESAK